MWLSKYNLKNIQTEKVLLPDLRLFDLPEKVLQFGTGVLLRGLPDYFIDKANKQGIFNGRIVVVKSTDGGDNWTKIGLDSTEHISKVIVDPANSSVIYAAAPGP